MSVPTFFIDSVYLCNTANSKRYCSRLSFQLYITSECYEQVFSINAVFGKRQLLDSLICVCIIKYFIITYKVLLKALLDFLL